VLRSKRRDTHGNWQMGVRLDRLGDTGDYQKVTPQDGKRFETSATISTAAPSSRASRLIPMGRARVGEFNGCSLSRRLGQTALLHGLVCSRARISVEEGSDA
jgi:hypothetical protein